MCGFGVERPSLGTSFRAEGALAENAATILPRFRKLLKIFGKMAQVKL